MPAPTTANATLVADFAADFPPSDKHVTFGFGLDGEIVAASQRSSLAAEPGVGLAPNGQLEAASDLQVLIRRRDEPQARVEIRGERTRCSFVQPVPDGVLLVSARCSWRESGAEQNAVVYDRAGKALRRFTLGDGINDVRVAADGSIWVSYFDEGVLGNRG